jgi:hypothetical protein
MSVAIDPVHWQVARWLLAGVFAAGFWHKLRTREIFVVVVRDYRILPAGTAPFAATLILLLEGLVLVGLISGMGLRTTAVLAALLLCVYGVAIAVNLVRGRRSIDCGCFGAAGDASGRHRLSAWLLVRNAALIGVTGLVLAPVSARELVWLDTVAIVPGVVAATLIYFTADQLLANRSILGSMTQ